MTFTERIVEAICDRCSGKTIERMSTKENRAVADAVLTIRFTDGEVLCVSTKFGPLIFSDEE